jgi:hypothetical protein
VHFLALKASPRNSQKNGTRPHGAGGNTLPGFTHLHRSASNTLPRSSQKEGTSPQAGANWACAAMDVSGVAKTIIARTCANRDAAVRRFDGAKNGCENFDMGIGHLLQMNLACSSLSR